MKLTITRHFGILILALLALSSCRNPENKIEPTCFDEIRNQGELRVDCGGPNCRECLPDCTDGIGNRDEQSPVSQLNTVAQVIGIDCGGEFCEPCATCSDGIQNAHWVHDPNLTEEDLALDSVAQSANGMLYRLVMETGIDCGFPCMSYCTPTGEDGIQNGDETGIDCGGSTGIPCPPATCSDGIQNGLETGIDCGDIPLELCGECPDPTCDDGIQNLHIELNDELPAGYMVVTETGIDCDNNPMSSCPDCPLPTCWDGVQNPNETGIDCGGGCGTPCDPTPTCANGIMDGTETGVDCDDDPTSPCPTCATCGDNIKNGPEFAADCVDYPIPGYTCEVCPSCHDGEMNPPEDNLYELDIDCGGPTCDDCLTELTAAAIGSGSGSPYRDQYSYNRILAQAGITDTLNLGPNYPGLKVTKVIIGSTYLKVESNQGFVLDEEHTFIRSLTLFIPIPESHEGVIAETYDMLNTAQPTLGLCEPFIGTQVAVPFLVYKERFLENNTATKCFRSYILDNEVSKLNYTYAFGGPVYLGYYLKGNITGGSIRTADGVLTQEPTLGIFEGIDFKLQYGFQ